MTRSRSTTPALRLRRDLARHLRSGHPWVYRDALEAADLPAGAIVDVTARDGRFLARGLYDPASPIAFRTLTLDPREAIDAAFVRRRIEAAIALRAGLLDPATTDAFRLLNGEGDHLPGVICDRYADVAVLRFDGEAAATLRPLLVEALRALPGVRTVYEKARGVPGHPLVGPAPAERVRVREHGVRFLVDLRAGQKTGMFLDQRENRRALRGLAATAGDCANLYSYSGGFSLNLALGGARRVTSVDVAAAALDDARANFADNGLDPAAHEFAAQDAHAWLADAARAGRRFDVMVVDPPSFAPSEKALDRARPAYRDLYAAALALVAPGGLYCPASCSSHLHAEDFLEVVREAASQARRNLRLLELRGQPGDHPTPLAFPEGRYLKFALCRA